MQLLCSNVGQVIHTYVPLSPASVTWYWPSGIEMAYDWHGKGGPGG